MSFTCISSSVILNFMASKTVSTLLFLGTFFIAISLPMRIKKMSPEKAEGLFWFYSVLIGAFISPICIIYTGESIVNAFLTTAAFFGGMSLYGYTTKKDLTALGSFMFVGLVTIIVASLVNCLWTKNSAFHLLLTALSVIIFCGLTAYDVQKIKSFYNPSIGNETLGKQATLGALVLYLDFLNLFLNLIRLLGKRR
ncbi:MAG: Bax inhibitor-1/YccA family protein [Holosporales bacterium]|nr:Bax inhibitor-1/YccA family protein [Holosporales bacterium]